MADDKPFDEKDQYFFFRYRPAFFAGFVQPAGPRPALPQIRPRIAIWTKHPAETDINYSTAINDTAIGKYYCEIDLGNTPSSCAAELVEVDDHVNVDDGFTTMGPNHPHAYGAAGVYLRLLKLQRSPVTPVAGDEKIPTDQTAIVVMQSSGVRRYHGFVGLHLSRPRSPGLNPPGPDARCRELENLWVVFHPGTGSDHGTQPPRKLIIPPASQLEDPLRRVMEAGVDPEIVKLLSVNTHENHHHETALYLERSYALYTAALNVPKKPSGCSEAEAGILTPRSAASAAPGSSPRSILNVLSANSGCVSADRSKVVATGEIDRIATKIVNGRDPAKDSFANMVRLEPGETLFDALSRHAQSSKQRFDYLDLIGHSRADDNILKLGEFALTSRVARREFAALVNSGILDKLGIKTIRLLGCRTACSARGQRVVATILTFFSGGDDSASATPWLKYPVYAARADLFAVHFDQFGLRPEAEPLLADNDVIVNAGPGDLPPGDDYPPDPPGDDDDDDDDDGGHGDELVVPPSEFSISALSDCNTAMVAANSYQYWPGFTNHFEELKRALCSGLPIQDNPLRKATREVLVPIAREPRSIDDLRSFDVMLEEAPPRIRVYTTRGDAYAFYFRRSSCGEVREYLATLGIDCRPTPPSGSEIHASSLSQKLTSWL